MTMSSSSGRPPLTEILATPQPDEEERKTHIEVCVRIRPLKVGKESSTSFLSSHNNNSSSSNNNTRSSGLASPSPSMGSSPRLVAPRTRLAAPTTSRIGGGINKSRMAAVTPSKVMESVDRTAAAASDNNDSESGHDYAWSVANHNTVRQSAGIDNLPGRTDSYTLDHVYGPDNNTQELFDQSVKGLVHAAMDGYHTSVLAYGQTSTGKTHTMTGTGKQPGLIPLAVRECFDYLSNISQPREYLIRLSYMEVYKEHIRDLLANATAQPAPIRLFESVADGLVIKGLKEQVVASYEQVFELLAEGESRRQVGATTMNAHSSRSHVIVRLWIESRAVPDGGANGGSSGNNNNNTQRITSASSTTSSLASSSPVGTHVRISSLSLVDLAGSESVKLTGNNDRRQEGHYINQSLMTLGKVVYALSDVGDTGATTNNGKKAPAKHIPYRDSKLTRLLQPSLSGNAQVVLVCCISPLAQHMEESHNTFKFAVRAKKIPQKAAIQEAPDEDRTMLQSYRDEIEELKRQLKEAQETKQQIMDVVPTQTQQQQQGSTSHVDLTGDIVSEDEIQELVMSIQTMEKLILKSKPISPMVHQRRPEDWIDHDAWDDDDDIDDEEDLIALASATRSEGMSSMSRSLQTPVRAPPPDDTDNRNLEIELTRIQGLLGGVLKKRKKHKPGGNSTSSSVTTATAPSSDEVLVLRAQLEQQEKATTIRKADSSFLQKQLEEKDDLLLEVSKVLEAVEQRQLALEKENAFLRAKVAELQQQQQQLQRVEVVALAS